jgi:transposase-like protein
MVVRIAGVRMYLWRAVDHEGEVLDMLVQRRRDSRAALRLMRKLLTAVHNTFNLQRHLVSRSTLRIFRAEAASEWRNAVAAV